MKTPSALLAYAATPLLLIWAASVQASWPASGDPVCTTPDFQENPHLAPDASGGTFLVWSDRRNNAVFGQRLDLNGNAQWSVNGVQLGPTNGSQHPWPVADGSGGFVVVWQTNFNIGAQHFDANATPLWGAGGVVVCNAAGNQDWPEAIRTPNGEYIVVWRDARNGVNRNDVFANRLSAAGTALWGGTNGVAVGSGTGDIGVGFTLGIKVVGDGSGGAYVTWSSTDLYDIFGQYISSAGARVWGGASGLTLCNAAGTQKWPRVLDVGGSGAIFAWEDERPGAVGAYAQRVTSGGAIQYAANGIQLFPGGGFGSLLLISTGYLANAGATIRLFQISNGAPIWPNPVSLSPDGDALELISDNANGAIGVYKANDGRLMAQRIDANGNVLWPSALDLAVGMAGMTSPAILTQDIYGGVVAGWQDYRAGVAGDYDVYAQRIEPNGAIGVLSNLDATSVFTPYWDSPVVPRNYPGGDVYNVHVSRQLDGNVLDTYLNSLVWQAGPNPIPAWVWQVTLDSEILASFSMPDSTPPGGYYILDGGPITVRGGRHTLAHDADPGHLVLENNETDNSYVGQWVWSPLLLGKGVGIDRPVPPDRSLFPNPSGDGFQLNRDVNFSWVISEAPRSYTDDYDLYVYDDYSGSSSGFSNLRKASLYSNDATDFVVGHFLGTPLTLYAQVVRYANGSGNDFAYDQIDATNRSASFGNFQNQVLGANRVADVYEAHLNAGVTYHFILNSLTPNTDLGMNLYPATAGAIYSRSDAMFVPGAAIGQAVGITSDVIDSYTASTSGYYPVVVYRQTGDDAASPATYSLIWNTGVVGVSAELEANRHLMFSGAVPNPVRSGTSFVFSLPKTASVRLSLYDLNGRLVRQLADETREPGEQRIGWDGTGPDGSRLSDGIYFARMETLGHVFSRRVVMIR